MAHRWGADKIYTWESTNAQWDLHLPDYFLQFPPPETNATRT